MRIPGTIVAAYGGDVHGTLYCLAAVGSYEVHDGDRLAQLAVSRLADVEWSVVDHLDTTERGRDGHGSTGNR